MKKYVSALIIALTTITLFSCTKKVDVNAVASILPSIQVSSLGMSTEGPYPTTSTVQLLFGATTTNKTPGAFDVTIYDASAASVAVETIHFNSWQGFDSTTPATATTGTLGSINYTAVPTEYPNTVAYQGSILLKLNKLTSGKTYNVTIKASTNDATPLTSTYSVKSLFFVQ